jgi:adenylate cyclase
VSAVGVHALWWRTATANSRELASTINRQIVNAVEREIASTAGEARAAYTAIRTLFLQNVLDTRVADKREFVFLSQLQSQATLFLDWFRLAGWIPSSPRASLATEGSR